jgi:hypothetical protein
MVTAHKILNIELNKLKTINDLDVKQIYQALLNQLELKTELDNKAYQEALDELETAYKSLDTQEKRQVYIQNHPAPKPLEKSRVFLLSELKLADGSVLHECVAEIAGDTKEEIEKNEQAIIDEYNKFVDERHKNMPVEKREKLKAVRFECKTYDDYTNSDYYKAEKTHQFTKEKFQPFGGLLVHYANKIDREDFNNFIMSKNYIRDIAPVDSYNNKSLKR